MEGENSIVCHIHWLVEYIQKEGWGNWCMVVVLYSASPLINCSQFLLNANIAHVRMYVVCMYVTCMCNCLPPSYVGQWQEWRRLHEKHPAHSQQDSLHGHSRQPREEKVSGEKNWLGHKSSGEICFWRVSEASETLFRCTECKFAVYIL